MQKRILSETKEAKVALTPLKLIATVVSFLSLLEVPLSFAYGDYFFKSIWIDLSMIAVLAAYHWYSRVQRGPTHKLALIGALPYELFISLLPVPYIEALRVLRLLRFASCYHVLRWSEYRSKALQVGAVTLALALVSHWVACGWMLTHDFEVVGFAENYVSSLYWAVMTLTTVGYGDVVPTGSADRIFSMLAMLMGVGVFGVVIGQF